MCMTFEKSDRWRRLFFMNLFALGVTGNVKEHVVGVIEGSESVHVFVRSS